MLKLGKSKLVIKNSTFEACPVFVWEVWGVFLF